MKRAVIRVTPELIKTLLRLPADTEVINARWDIDRFCIDLHISHADLDEVAELSEPPVVTMQYDHLGRFSKWHA